MVIMNKLPENLTEEEFLNLISLVKKEHHKLAFSLGFYEGLRISEIINLKPDNLDWGQKLLRVKQGKGGKDRNIPILPEVYTQLKKKAHLLPLKCGVRALEIAFKGYVKLLGTSKNLHFHSLRHSCGTWLLNVKKWDVRLVQQFLGHSRLDTTQIYTHVSPKDLLEMAWGKDTN